jgi:hypothetical protein
MPCVEQLDSSAAITIAALIGLAGVAFGDEEPKSLFGQVKH